MTFLAIAGAPLQCSFGAAPSVLNVIPIKRVVAGTPVATVTDNLPFVNVPPFGVCSCPANPVVAAATAAAFGVLTPMPCVPVCGAPWMPGALRTMIGNTPALDVSSKLMCQWGGIIQVVSASQATITVA
ncbi:hypothetical protein WM40_03765 [Robbsia andropogonis]|uniref:DUF4280 domain-containing protein n=1 Tax=Robbsia andropogonis TaxID=28092 RepID=A0A0F5K3Y5_9BURK|nr:DUF4280 domain-containing protein [Robbsia andropogonis]KKB64574.1 hypothetical protein WM40_03765 [Robbsia andropogonis]